MTSPFPGMDPYLEEPEGWSDFHTRLATVMSDLLLPRVRPAYWVGIERRVVLTAEPGERPRWIRPEGAVARVRPSLPTTPLAPAGLAGAVAVQVQLEEPFDEPYLVIRLAGRRREVVTVIELASPTNKGDGHAEYLEKRNEILRSRTSLVEIDLLRRLYFRRFSA